MMSAAKEGEFSGNLAVEGTEGVRNCVSRLESNMLTFLTNICFLSKLKFDGNGWR